MCSPALGQAGWLTGDMLAAGGLDCPAVSESDRRSLMRRVAVALVLGAVMGAFMAVVVPRERAGWRRGNPPPRKG